jgi:hypothetical protein
MAPTWPAGMGEIAGEKMKYRTRRSVLPCICTILCTRISQRSCSGLRHLTHYEPPMRNLSAKNAFIPRSATAPAKMCPVGPVSREPLRELWGSLTAAAVLAPEAMPRPRGVASFTSAVI